MINWKLISITQIIGKHAMIVTDYTQSNISTEDVNIKKAMLSRFNLCECDKPHARSTNRACKLVNIRLYATLCFNYFR